MLGDIAALTGGTLISEDLGMKLENLTLEHLGRAKKITVDKDNTTIVKGAGKQADIQDPHPADSQPDRRHRERLRPREVPGAAGQADRRRGDHFGRRRHRSRHEAEEGPRRRRPARHACGGRRRHSARRRRGPAALPRGGREGPLAAPRATRRSASTSCCTPCRAPLQQIADNCGIDGSVVADEVSQKPTNTGYDANAGKYVDMFKAGIIDPVKVVRTALSNAASIAGLMLTTEALVTDLRQGRQSQAARRRQHSLERLLRGERINGLAHGPLQQALGWPVCGAWTRPFCCIRDLAGGL